MSTTHTHRLANGLRVLMHESHAAPLLTCWLWYRVGVRNETFGKTGLSHWVEHMLYKGTTSLAKGELERQIARNGGVFNGFTAQDFTAYYTTLPADQASFGLWIEADRMANALFDPSDVESERTVILAEREGNENFPKWWLREAVRAAAFQTHPYRNEVIGWKHDIATLTREDLYHHYRTYYNPGNAVLVLIGDFESDAILQHVEYYFGGLPAGPQLLAASLPEPEQQGERRVIVRRPGPARYIDIVYHTPGCTHADFAPLMMLDALLSGMKLLDIGGQTPPKRSTRLYQALVDAQFASDARSAYRPTIDPYLFDLSANAHAQQPIEVVEAALLQVIERVQQDGVAAEEIAIALQQCRVQVAFAREQASRYAQLLGMWEMLDSYRRAETLYDELAEVTPADVQRVAQTYLVERYRTIGYFIPTDPQVNGHGSRQIWREHQSYGPELVDSRAGVQPDTPAQPRRMPKTATRSPATATRHVLSNGMVALIQNNPSSSTVSVRGEIRIGAVHEPAAKNGLAALTGAALMRGAAERTFQQISAAIEARGARISANGATHTTRFGGQALAEDLPLVLETLADMLIRPTFSAIEIERLRGRHVSSLRKGQQETRAQAMHAACALLYPATHPYSRPGNGTIPTVERLAREDVLSFHRQYHPAVTALAVVGAVDAAAVIEWLEQTFGGWESLGSPPALNIPPAPRLCETRRCTITVPGTMQSDVIWAVPGPRRTDSDYYAASVANTILGRLGLGGRLGDTLRKQRGLAYHCASILDADIGPNPWMVIADVNPAGVTHLIDAIHHEILRFCSDGPDSQELHDAHAFMSGSLALGLETNDGIAATLLSIERFGLGLDYIARYPALVRSITAEQIIEVLRAYLAQEHYVVAVAGPPGAGTNGIER